MSQGIYPTITRQAGLMKEMQIVANNVANASTTGFRAEGMIFSEYVKDTGADNPSVSMALSDTHVTRNIQGGMSQTNGTFDLAIEGDGFFQLQTPEGVALTRAGAFTPNAEGDLVNFDGHAVLDAGGAPVFVPPDAQSIHIGVDGTVSADGLPVAQVGLVMPLNVQEMTRTDGVSFIPEGGVGPVEIPRMMQGFLEDSNVNAVREIARMIEVQHAYQAGQSFMDKEHERTQSILRLIGR